MNNERRTVIFRGVKFNKYEIDRKGNIYRKGSDTPLKPWDDMRGYLKVDLMTDDNMVVSVKNHLASAHTFIGPQENGMVVKHLDNNKHNPAVDNLAYDTQRGNVRDAQIEVKGIKYLNEEEYKSIQEDLKNGLMISEIAKKHDLNSWIINDIKRGKTYTFYGLNK